MRRLKMPRFSRRELLMTAAGFGGGAIVTDLSTLFSDPAQGAAQNMQYRQGTIISFNQITLENVVNVGGQNMVNLPVLGVAEAATYVPGAVVGLMIINSSWAIIGRFVVPNTPAATDAITQLSQAIVSDFIVTQESTSSAAFVDLTTIGPTVVANIKTSGRCLVFTSATISIQPGANFPSAWGGFVSLDVSGANTIAPTAINGSLGFIFGDNALNQSWVQSFTRMIVLSGLNPGLTTFRAKYAVNLGGPPETALFRNRGLAVFSL